MIQLVNSGRINCMHAGTDTLAHTYNTCHCYAPREKRL